MGVCLVKMGILQQFNINELAGATGLILGALGGLLAVIWKSRCHCKMNLCYICQCERKPPPDEAIEPESEDEETLIPRPQTTQTPEPEPESEKNISIRKLRSVLPSTVGGGY